MVSEYCPPWIKLAVKVAFDEYELYLSELKLLMNKLELSDEFKDKAKKYRRFYMGTEIEHRLELKELEKDMSKKLSENQKIIFKRPGKGNENYTINDIRVL